jgi:purine-binding chemotaxis protein CheW
MARIPPPKKDAESARDNNQAMEDYMASFFIGVEEALPEEARSTEINPTTLAAEPAIPAFTESLPKALPKPPVAKALPKPPVPKYPAKSTPLPPKLLAEQVPSDVRLNPLQKKGLQRLLDTSINHAVVDAVIDVTPALLPPVFETLNAHIDRPASIGVTEVLSSVADENMATHRPVPVVAEDIEPDPLVMLPNALEPEDLSATAESMAPQGATLASIGQSDSLKPGAKIPAIISPEEFRAHWQGQLPAWGHKTFDVLLFSCRGVTLAIPLISLGHIYLHNQPLNILPHLPSWVLGVKPVADGKLKVADAGAYFLPDRPATLDIENELHIIGLADSDWAFAVDSVANPTKIHADDVQWRPFSKTSPWLAGAIKRQMCVLIDTPALIKQLGG